MKRTWITRTIIEIDDNNWRLCGSKCPKLANTLSTYHRKKCTQSDEMLIAFADGKPFPETFLRTASGLLNVEIEDEN